MGTNDSSSFLGLPGGLPPSGPPLLYRVATAPRPPPSGAPAHRRCHLGVPGGGAPPATQRVSKWRQSPRQAQETAGSA
eukprot:3619430-Alexandrium_andersonii.AAC.1